MSRTRAVLRELPPRVHIIEQRTALPPKKRAAEFYSSPEWRALLADVIRERQNPDGGNNCEICPKVNCRVIGDHKVELRDGGAPLDRRNIQLLCWSCHTCKTVAARAARTARVFELETRPFPGKS